MMPWAEHCLACDAVIVGLLPFCDDGCRDVYDAFLDVQRLAYESLSDAEKWRLPIPIVKEQRFWNLSVTESAAFDE